MKNIGIIAKDIPKARRAASKVARWLTARGRKVYIDSTTAAALKVQGYERSRIPSLPT
jgi:hypothetical protein